MFSIQKIVEEGKMSNHLEKAEQEIFNIKIYRESVVSPTQWQSEKVMAYRMAFSGEQPCGGSSSQKFDEYSL
ncbi:hypothetical protein [Heyndrickxia camelliae]|uniref:Uncharacterized protein n=1 Tax=Heyndrickxia camelliae TaxID=1707093 RepID=A0A2N3LDH3_9BACI|nr:hypothetical protein [Heyndrickxia camelliae]PKR82625.1 hypothetical protein CWO92_23450 [Heyndrickxia camelliae]